MPSPHLLHSMTSSWITRTAATPAHPHWMRTRWLTLTYSTWSPRSNRDPGQYQLKNYLFRLCCIESLRFFEMLSRLFSWVEPVLVVIGGDLNNAHTVERTRDLRVVMWTPYPHHSDPGTCCNSSFRTCLWHVRQVFYSSLPAFVECSSNILFKLSSIPNW